MDIIYVNEKYMDYRTIYGDYLENKPIGYCHCFSHPEALTRKIMVKHECRKKECPYFAKNVEHEFWINKAKWKKQKKMKNAQ